MAVLNEEQEMLRDMARDWAVNESPVTEFRKVRASGEPEAFNRDAYATMAQMGWAGVIIPEEHGGSDFGFLSAGLVVEELGKTLTASPLVMNTVAASAIVLGGSDEQKARWLPRLASGEAIATLAVDEGPSHDPAKIETSVSDGKLSGTKAFVHEAHGADLFVVAAKDGLYLVEKGDGVALTTRKLTDQRSHADVTFDGAAAEKLANGGDNLLDDVLDRARPGAATPHGGPLRRSRPDAQRGRGGPASRRCRLRRGARGDHRQGGSQPRYAHHGKRGHPAARRDRHDR
jgi:alkylation response protein AidB-like acyl-CoA dehydrogenase